MDSFDYIHAEKQRQFSDEKREQVETARVGMGKDNQKLTYLQKLAGMKSQSVRKCEMCDSIVMVHDIHQTPFLCNRHEHHRKILLQEKGRGSSRLKGNTLRVGPFFNPKA